MSINLGILALVFVLHQIILNDFLKLARHFFSERGIQRIFQIASSLSRDRVLEKRVNILQRAMHVSVSGLRSVGDLYGMVFELILGC